MRVAAPEALDELRSVKRRGLLSIVLLQANQRVHEEKLLNWLWRDEDGSENLAELRRTVTKVRRVLKRTPSRPELRREGEYYRLDVNPDLVDFHVFRRLAKEGAGARERREHRKALSLLESALELWPEPVAFENVPLSWARQASDRLVEHELVPACRDYYETHLALEHYDVVVSHLRQRPALLERNETIAAVYVRALAVVEDADAVADFRERFADGFREHFGEDPSERFFALCRRLIDEQPPASAYGLPEPPCLLPRDVPDFVGREDLLTTLDDWLVADDVPGVAALDGLPGSGKTAIAKHWARTRAEHFVHGQLYADLEGFGPARPLAPSAVLARFLAVLGVHQADLPHGVEERVMLLRHKLRGRRVLVVLDNVRDAAHVRPLLDATAPCSVLVTSRNRLGLADCRHLTVPSMAPHEAVALLHRRIRDGRARHEAGALRNLARLCDGLPLGLRIAAEYVAARSDVAIGDLVGQLGSRQRLLDLSSPGDSEYRTLRAVFTSSFALLRPEAQRLLRLLGLHPSASITSPVAAAMAGTPVPDVEDVFAVLLGARLVDQKTVTGYRVHDLVHAYAGDSARRYLGEAERREALVRMVEFYRTTVDNAVRTIEPSLTEVPAMAVPSGVTPLEFADPEEALAWCTEQRAQVLAVSRVAADEGLHEQVWRIVGRFAEVLKRHGDPREVVEVHEMALRSAQIAASRLGEAMLTNNLGSALLGVDEFEQAETAFRRALQLSRELGDDLGQAVALHNAGHAAFLRGYLARAGRLFTEGLELFTRLEHRLGRCKAYLHLGDIEWRQGRARAASLCYRHALAIERHPDVLAKLAAFHHETGEPDVAVEYGREALRLHREARHERAACGDLLVLAEALHDLAEHEEAMSCAREATSLAESCGDLRTKAAALELTGVCAEALEARGRAAEFWTAAADLFEELGDSRAARVRARLAEAGAARVMPEQRRAGNGSVEDLRDLPAGQDREARHCDGLRPAEPAQAAAERRNSVLDHGGQ
ncbi:tetratricopeptide repeat protein [Amycolatopsis thermalba]|uniref:Tetratricopeptide repeat protein n=1 Tax=Amycolatopsis thermalba TaxID=944492 RepID=A0ABY4NRR2_9PSEU|nr:MULTISPECIES: tetratricopeptide repeat protein [Amycolatopsis]UQS22756.1 tetratricopeptide repeat protein [Amycolatopsis thermalba]